MRPAQSNLPLQLTRFIDRDGEVTQIGRKLSMQRCVTLTGPGGVGKTRLALEVGASILERYPDGVWFIELAALTDPRLVPQAVAVPLGVRPAAQIGLDHSLLNFLKNKHVLLVLDNCEHLVDACASLADLLLRNCANLHILATSRQPLRIAGEWTWRVPPLSIPRDLESITAEQLLEFGAARLFVDRAAAAAGFQLTDQLVSGVARVCQRLDGIPLALELAAARVASLGLTELCSRLDDALRVLVSGSRTAPPRHRALEATIDWSYQLLCERERIVLDRLAVFAGGFAADSVEAIVVDGEVQRDDVLGILSALVDKSLVVAEPLEHGGVRYRLQEVVRQYAMARLTERGGLEALKAEHAASFVDLVQKAEPGVLRGARESWQNRLESDLDNFRAARAWLVEHGETESALRLNAYLFLLLAYRGYASEGRASLREALGMSGGSVATRGRALHCLALLAYLQADYWAAAMYGTESLSLRREVGNPAELSWTLLERGTTAGAQAEFDVAEPLLAEACEASRLGGSGYVHAYATAMLAYVAYLKGDLRVARERAERAIELGRASTFIAPTAHALSTLAEISCAEGDLAAARVAFEAALDRARAPGEVYLFGRPMLGLAQVAIDQGDIGRARGLLIESLALARRLGNPHRVAQTLEGVAAYAARLGDSALARKFSNAALAIRSGISAPRSPIEARLLEQRLRVADSIADVASIGHWSLDQACSLALELLQTESAPNDSDALLRGVLTQREAQVAALVARGLSNREIARTLTIAERTATSHVEHVLSKLGFHSRAQIATWVTQQRRSAQ
jgi:non-specific serine/threonine protein kinase